jgi:GxxExxY protein
MEAGALRGRLAVAREPQNPGDRMRELIEGSDEVINDQLTGSVIGGAIEVHRRLGPGFLEAVYGRALRCELTARGIGWAAEVEVPVLYRGMVVGRHRLDLVVAGQIVVELKAVSRLEVIHFAQIRSYLAAAGLRVGLLLNFEQTQLTVRRVVDRALKEQLRGSRVPSLAVNAPSDASPATAVTPTAGS